MLYEVFVGEPALLAHDIIYSVTCHTLKTGTPVEDGDSNFKLLREVSRPEIQLGVGTHSELDFSSVHRHTAGFNSLSK